MKKLICLLLGALILLGGCTPATETVLPGEAFSVTEDFVIITPFDATEYETNAATALRDAIKEATGITLEIQLDIYAEADNELIVGASLHADAYEKYDSLGELDWFIQGMPGNKLVMAAGSESGWNALLDYFKQTYIADGKVTLSTGINHGHVEAPRILRISPEDNTTIALEATPTLYARFLTGVGVDESKSSLKIDGVEVENLTWDAETVTGIAPTLNNGEHTVELTVTDKLGQSSAVTSKFVIKPLSEFSLFRGEIHSHTAESDGEGTLEEAYTYARDKAGFDFFAVTDHANKMTWEGYSAKQIPIADSFNVDGKFTALYGVEATWGTLGEGHINVIMPSRMYCGIDTVYGLHEFYSVLSRDNGAVGMFNHSNLTHGKFEDFANWSPVNDESMNLFEFQSVNAFNTYENYYAQALTMGWHLSPAHNEDTHNATWGTGNAFHTVVLAENLTRNGITEALHQGRTYITTDTTAELTFTVNGTATLGGTAVISGETAKVHIELKTESPQGVSCIELIGNNGVTIAAFDTRQTSPVVWDVEIPVENDFIYVRLNKGNVKLLSAPIYLEHTPVLTVTDPVVALADDGRHALQFDLGTTQSLTDVKAEFWIGAQANTDLTVAPSYTADIGTLTQTATVTGYVTYSRPTYSFITVRISGKNDAGKSVGLVYSQPVSPYYITEIVTLTSASNGISNAFTYIEIYNNTNKEMDLSSYNIGIYSQNQDVTEAIKEGYSFPENAVVAPRSTAVLWVKGSANDLTAADFNAFYGTNLVEGETLFTFAGASLPCSTSHRTHLVVYRRTTEITRVSYNYLTALRGKEYQVDTSLEYGVHVLPSLDQPRFATKATPSPGALSTGQLPVLK